MQLQNIKIKQCISSIFHKNDSDTKKELEAYILILVNPSISSMTSLQSDTVCEFLCVHKNIKAHVPMRVNSVFISFFPPYFVDKVSY